MSSGSLKSPVHSSVPARCGHHAHSRACVRAPRTLPLAARDRAHWGPACVERASNYLPERSCASRRTRSAQVVRCSGGEASHLRATSSPDTRSVLLTDCELWYSHWNLESQGCSAIAGSLSLSEYRVISNFCGKAFQMPHACGDQRSRKNSNIYFKRITDFQINWVPTASELRFR